jgi:hypothetical protein
LDRGGNAKDHIGYQALVQSAMKGVLRQALQKVCDLKALPGEHHFYITFRTRTPGVQMADHLKDRFPDEMTIVVQHQYWDFEVHDDRFEIILKFAGIPQHLRVPFSAVTRFFDPSVNFGLQFDADMRPQPETRTGTDPTRITPPAAAATPTEGGEATVVSLDAFRRK